MERTVNPAVETINKQPGEVGILKHPGVMDILKQTGEVEVHRPVEDVGLARLLAEELRRLPMMKEKMMKFRQTRNKNELLKKPI